MLAFSILVGCIEYRPVQVDETSPPVADSGADSDVFDTDVHCATEGRPAGGVDVNAACEPPIPDPWNIALEWKLVVLDDGRPGLSYDTPIVSPLRDENLDGRIDESDPPAILVNVLYGSPRTLVALDGRDRSTLWTWPYTTIRGVAASDLSTGSAREVVAFLDSDGLGRTHVPVLLSADGLTLWAGADDGAGNAKNDAPEAWPVVTDLEGDGRPEILFGESVYDGTTGDRLAFLGPFSANYAVGAAGDADGDGRVEIAIDGVLFDADLTPRWHHDQDDTWMINTAAIVDVDGDPEGEIVFLGTRLAIYDPDGTPLLDVEATEDGGIAGPMSIADFDGDGENEIAYGDSVSGQVLLRDLDGTLLWTRPADELSDCCIGVTGWDLDDDGAWELIIADSDSVDVVDGRTGAERYSFTDHDSGTGLIELAVVVDVDMDGEGEILFVNNNTPESERYALMALGHVGGGWPKGGWEWPRHDWGGSSDLSRPWDAYNLVRAVPPVDRPAADLTLSLLDVCTASCDRASPAWVTLEVANTGVVEATAEVALLRPNGSAVASRTVTVQPGERLADVVFEVRVGDLVDVTATILTDAPQCDTSDDQQAIPRPCSD